MSKVGRLFREMRRRGVLHATAFYVLASWAVLQAADVLFPGAGIPGSAIKFVVIGAVLGFPLMLVFGWRYDITVSGILRTAPLQNEAGAVGLRLRRSDYFVLCGLGAAAVALVVGVSARVISEAGETAVVADTPAAAENSIAVLPFVNMSSDPDSEYLGDGITEELLNSLSNLTRLHVAARTSSFFFKGKNEPVQSIGRQLGVRTILEGSVRRDGNRIRITAQLVDAERGYHLWSQTFDRQIGDIFAIQEEIAESIASALEITVLNKESRSLAKAPTESIDAYDLYLLAQFHREHRNRESIAKSIELFKQALEQDDHFALGYAGLAASYLYQAYYNDLAPERVVELTTPLIQKALELDPLLAEGYSIEGSVRLLVRDFAAADTAYRKALELKPNYAAVWSNLGFSLVLQSRLKEAADAYRKSEALDPLNANLKFNIGALSMLTGQYDAGREALVRVTELAPERNRVEAAIAHWCTVYGRFEEAMRWAMKALDREPESATSAATLAQIYGDLGLWDKAWEYISIALANSPDNDSFIDLTADYYFQSGNYAGFTAFVDQQYDKIDPLAPSRLSPTNKTRYRWHGMAALSEGNYVQAIDDLTDAAGGPSGIASAVYDDIRPLKYLAYAEQMQGRHEEADALLQQCLELATASLEQGWATPTIHYRTAQVYALLGRTDDAIEQLRTAIDKGWRAAGGLEKDPLWTPLQGDVRFQEIVTRVNNDIRLQRERITRLMDEGWPDL